MLSTQPQPIPPMTVAGNRNVKNVPVGPDGRDWSNGLCNRSGYWGTCAYLNNCLGFCTNRLLQIVFPAGALALSMAKTSAVTRTWTPRELQIPSVEVQGTSTGTASFTVSSRGADLVFACRSVLDLMSILTRAKPSPQVLASCKH